MKQDITDQSTNEKIRQWIRKAVVSGIRENIFDYFIDDFTSILIHEILQITDGNRTNAAKLIGLPRPTLQSKIEKYKIKIEASVKNE